MNTNDDSDSARNAPPYSGTILSLLAIFSPRTHRGKPLFVHILSTGSNIFIVIPPPATNYLGTISHRQVLSWFFAYAERTTPFISGPVSFTPRVVALKSINNALDCMKLISEHVGVSPQWWKKRGTFLSATNIVAIGKLISILAVRALYETNSACLPSQINQVFSIPIQLAIKARRPIPLRKRRYSGLGAGSWTCTLVSLRLFCHADFHSPLLFYSVLISHQAHSRIHVHGSIRSPASSWQLTSA